MGNVPLLNENHIEPYLELKKQRKTDKEIVEKHFFCNNSTLTRFKKRFGIKVQKVRRRKQEERL
ncbi:hypothetical protein B5V89_18660 [Heyndrickxia sporothermodurans]|nr:hypothetical protein B5V89_18660 [Heyndrickxia sporothermodurans]